jgi:hypothetical protein
MMLKAKKLREAKRQGRAAFAQSEPREDVSLIYVVLAVSMPL